MTMHYRDVTSSQAHKVGYDSTQRLLEIHFAGGGIYQYEPITPAEYDALMRAVSFGKHFHLRIKRNDAIVYRKIEI